MMQSNVRARLEDALRDLRRDSGGWCYYVDHTGDEAGDLIYSCDGDLMKCGYEISDQAGKAVVTLDSENAVDVVPITTYQEEADEAEHYATMEAALKAENLYTDLPLYERFIAKSERDAAGSSDFAGKGKSFPILKPEDVMAAVRSMGRAGSGNLGPSGIKGRIIAIAKRKGWQKYLPKAWQGGAAQESAVLANVPRETISELKLVESWDWNQQALDLIEASGNPVRMKIKLIAPGKGSSAFYPAEVLKRDGPEVFKNGTHIYINHATPAEEAARPEGDWHKLAGALDGNAYWDESAKQGPGLYGNALFTSEHAPLIKEKAPFTGMSIRASGVAESGKSKDGLPVLKSLTSAESVDVVTRAGAGGMILTESARPAGEGDGMTLEEAKKLIEESTEKAIAPYRTRAIRGDAREEAGRLLESATLPKETKDRIIESVMRDVPMKDGEIDLTKFREAVVAETKREGEYLARVTGSGQVRGLGMSLVPALDPAKLKEAREREVDDEKSLREAELNVFGRLTGSPDAAKRIVERQEVA